MKDMSVLSAERAATEAMEQMNAMAIRTCKEEQAHIVVVFANWIE